MTDINASQVTAQEQTSHKRSRDTAFEGNASKRINMQMDTNFQWDYHQIISPVLKGLEGVKSLVKKSALEQNDVIVMKDVWNDFRKILAEVTSNPHMLFNEIFHKNRYIVNRKILTILVKYNASLDDIVLQCQMLWRMNFTSHILKLLRGKNVKSLNSFIDMTPNRELLLQIKNMKTAEDISKMLTNVKLVNSLACMHENGRFLRPVSHVPEQKIDVENLSFDQIFLVAKIQNGREYVKALLLSIWKMKADEILTEDETLKFMSKLRQLVPLMVIMDKMLCLSYLIQVSGTEIRWGVPWSNIKDGSEFQFVTDFIRENCNNFFCITNSLKNIIKTYFPELMNHLNPCLPSYFAPEDTPRVKWKKMYFQQADFSWKMFWQSEIVNEDVAINEIPDIDIPLAKVSSLSIAN